MADPQSRVSARPQETSNHVEKATDTILSRIQTTRNDYGDFVWQHDLDVIENSEAQDQYQSGSHCCYPVRIGDRLNRGNYRIKHKLGHGGFSTVWMAYDKKRDQSVALKIMFTGGKGDRSAQKELSTQEEIIKTIRDTEGASSLLTYLDHFLLPGDPTAGSMHHVLVFPLRGPTIHSWMTRPCSPALWPSMKLRMTAAWQLLKALEVLHGSGFIHSDLNNCNVMWGIDNKRFDCFSTDTQYKYVGRPRKNVISGPPEARIGQTDPINLAHLAHPGSSPEIVGPLGRLPKTASYTTWRPGGAELVEPMKFPKSLLEEKIYLGDFGLTFKRGTPVQDKVQSPAVFCAPERFHGQDPTPASDMWSYMCIFAHLFLHVVPFDGVASTRLLGDLVSRFGPLPLEWKGTFEGYHVNEVSDAWWYDPNTECVPEMTLPEVMGRTRPEARAEERGNALSVMYRGFSYRPERRITVTELLQDLSFRAIMALHQVDMS